MDNESLAKLLAIFILNRMPAEHSGAIVNYIAKLEISQVEFLRRMFSEKIYIPPSKPGEGDDHYELRTIERLGEDIYQLVGAVHRDLLLRNMQAAERAAMFENQPRGEDFLSLANSPNAELVIRRIDDFVALRQIQELVSRGRTFFSAEESVFESVVNGVCLQQMLDNPAAVSAILRAFPYYDSCMSALPVLANGNYTGEILKNAEQAVLLIDANTPTNGHKIEKLRLLANCENAGVICHHSNVLTHILAADTREPRGKVEVKLFEVMTKATPQVLATIIKEQEFLVKVIEKTKFRNTAYLYPQDELIANLIERGLLSIAVANSTKFFLAIERNSRDTYKLWSAVKRATPDEFLQELEELCKETIKEAGRRNKVRPVTRT